MIVLDSCIMFYAFTYPEIRKKLIRYNDKIKLCAPARAEFFYGTYCLLPKKERQKEISKYEELFGSFQTLAFDAFAADIYAKINAEMKEKNVQPPGIFDMQIAAIARLHGYSLVTENLKDFRKISYLKIENWEKGLPKRI